MVSLVSMVPSKVLKSIAEYRAVLLEDRPIGGDCQFALSAPIVSADFPALDRYKAAFAAQSRHGRAWAVYLRLTARQRSEARALPRGGDVAPNRVDDRIKSSLHGLDAY